MHVRDNQPAQLPDRRFSVLPRIQQHIDWRLLPSSLFAEDAVEILLGTRRNPAHGHNRTIVIIRRFFSLDSSENEDEELGQSYSCLFFLTSDFSCNKSLAYHSVIGEKKDERSLIRVSSVD